MALVCITPTLFSGAGRQANGAGQNEQLGKDARDQTLDVSTFLILGETRKEAKEEEEEEDDDAEGQ
ncbi:hypothetical protein VSDG_09150 [Cytospora chrysosperma]|uniref:Uncharacterized protein n=1 Tax=Cytospora chrysosperma TaxID=252740 RepID=A0A423VCH6_CYTCH|nr:hypothetical protein VSDG_09150 [Valsa sordida]